MRRRANLPLSAIMTRRLWVLVVRAAFLTVASFTIAFGFLSGTMASGPHYDPQAFAVGTAALFGAACGVLGILVFRIRQMKRDLRTLEARLDEAEDRNWETREARERAKSFFEAQGDVIVRCAPKAAASRSWSSRSPKQVESPSRLRHGHRNCRRRSQPHLP